MKDKFFRIEDVASMTGLTKRALRYYEDIDLINPKRTNAGYRLYSENDIEKIRKIIELKESLGFTLNEIKIALELEEDLKDVLMGNTYSLDMIKKAIDMVDGQIKLIEKKQQTLSKVKLKYQNMLSKLKAMYDDEGGR